MRRAVYVLAQRDDETMNYTPSIVAREDYCTDTLKPGLDKLEPGLRKSGRKPRSLFHSGLSRGIPYGDRLHDWLHSDDVAFRLLRRDCHVQSSAYALGRPLDPG